MLKFTIIAFSLILLNSSLHAKFRIGKAYRKAFVEHTTEIAINELLERSKQYYNNMDDKLEKTMDKSSTKSSTKSNKNILRYSHNGIKIIAKYPLTVKKGKEFIVEIEMINNLKNARMGGLTLSFPQYSSLDGAIIKQKFDSVKGYAPPQKMYSSLLKRNIKIKYFVIEGWENKWNENTSRSIKIKLVAPSDNNELNINLRGVLILGNKKSKYEITNPSNKNSLYRDQQGFYVKKINIKLRD